MPTNSYTPLFDKIYATDLVYVKDCWRLCGDAYCCGFQRYKRKFKLLAKDNSSELLLLPGEYEYLETKGWLEQFGKFDHKLIEYPLDDKRCMRIESIVSYKPGCVCNHAFRPTVCRLYPLLPILEEGGGVFGIDTLSIYDDLERMECLETACKVSSIPLVELDKFLAISSEIARWPLPLFYVIAYRLVKNHICSRLRAERVGPGNAFAVFEKKLLWNKLIDHPELKIVLARLADRFQQRYGAAFESNLSAPLVVSAVSGRHTEEHAW